MKLAVASKEGLGISEHFGHAKRFWIYQVGSGKCELLDIRQVEHYCLGGTSNSSALSGILESIKDCHAVFVAKIGDGPIKKLQNIGVEANQEYAYEEIEPSLLEYYRKNIAG